MWSPAELCACWRQCDSSGIQEYACQIAEISYIQPQALDGDLHIAVRFTFECDTLDAESRRSFGAADRIQNQLNTRRNAKLVENMEQVVFDCMLRSEERRVGK